jgi:manganese efflux pump family protein
MDAISIILIALGLAADCFAVSLSGSVLRKYNTIQMARTAFTFGVFQFAMPLIGWLAGRTVVDIISGLDHWIAFGLLALIGGRMIWEYFKEKEEQDKTDISKGMLLLTLGIATSIDALAVGLGFAFLNINIWFACGVIGAVAFGMTLIGFLAGNKAGPLLGRQAKLAGGLILIGIGLRIMITHLLGK